MSRAEPVRLGILGTADINRKLLAGARETTAISVIAVGSRTAERAREFAAAHGIGRLHDSYEGLLADPEVEAVYIPLPNSLHHPWTLRALAAGKHVLCEKPYSRIPAEVVEAFDAADRAGLVLMEAFMWRHSPQTLRLLELLPEIGELRVIHASFSFRLEEPGDIRLDPELAGGSLMDVGCYCVSGARLLAGGEPERIHAEAAIGPTGVDLGMDGLLAFPGGAVAHVSSAFTTEDIRLDLIGTRGTITATEPWFPRRGLILVDGREVWVDAGDPYGHELENFAGAIRGTALPRLGRADALGQARTIDALYRSAASGRAVTLGAVAPEAAPPRPPSAA